MADNFTWEESASGIEFASDDVSGVHYQIVKLALGAADAAALAPGDSTDGLKVQAVLLAGDANVGNVDVVTMPDAVAVGKAAADAAMSGNPVLIAGRASAVVPSAVSADDDVAYLWLDRNGRLTIRTRPTGKTTVHAQVAYSAGQTAATVYTPASGKKLCVTHLVISASAAGAVKLFDGTDSSGNAWSPNLSLAANGGWEAHFSDEHPLVMGANDNVLKYTSGAGAAGSIWLHGWEE